MFEPPEKVKIKTEDEIFSDCAEFFQIEQAISEGGGDERRLVTDLAIFKSWGNELSKTPFHVLLIFLMNFFILQKSMGGVASRLQGGEGARRLEESGEEVRCVIRIWEVVMYTYCCWIGASPSFQVGNPLGRGTKRRREVEDDIKVSLSIKSWSSCNQYAGSVEEVDQL